MCHRIYEFSLIASVHVHAQPMFKRHLIDSGIHYIALPGASRSCYETQAPTPLVRLTLNCVLNFGAVPNAETLCSNALPVFLTKGNNWKRLVTGQILLKFGAVIPCNDV